MSFARPWLLRLHNRRARPRFRKLSFMSARPNIVMPTMPIRPQVTATDLAAGALVSTACRDVEDGPYRSRSSRLLSVPPNARAIWR